MKRLPSFLAVVAAVLAPASVEAQARDWNAYRDSLRGLADVPALVRLQGRLPMPGMATTPEALLERGFIGLRIWELTHETTDAERAEAVFERGVERFADVAWLHYGLALAYAAHDRSQRDSPEGITVGASIAEILSRDPASRARKAAREAIVRDPSIAGAAVLIAELAVRDGRDREALRDARGALHAVRDAGHGSAEVNRALADVETALGNYGEATTALESVGAGDASGLHARAISLLLQPGRSEEGAAAYFAALDSIDEQTADRLFRDVVVIAAPNELADWQAADNTFTRQLWIERFWSRRAAESGVPESERLAAHYQRLALARRDYLRNSSRGVDGSGVLLSRSWVDNSPFDDRGIVLLKRGLPHSVVRTRSDGVLSNETWVYPGLEGGNQMFHFVALRGSRDFNLVSDLLQALDPVLDPIGDKSRFDRAVITLIADRGAFEPRYQTLAARLPSELATLRDANVLDATGVRNMVRTMVSGVDADYRREARVSLSGDSYTARFDRALPFHYDLFTFRAPFGRTDLTAAFAAPAEGVAALEVDDRFVYPMSVSVILMDTLTDEVMRTDTVLRIRPERIIGPGDFVRGYVTMPVVPSEHTVYRMVVRNTPIDAGAVYAGDIALRDYTGLGIQISDLVLASPAGNGGWTRGDVALDVTLPRRFTPDNPFTLYYEIYNLEADDPYSTHLRVESDGGGGIFGGIKRLFGFGGPRVDLRFDDRATLADDGAIREIRDLGTDLPPGRYRMTVTIVNQRTYEEASSQTILDVVG
jgi:GWxTD domain-containing protein